MRLKCTMFALAVLCVLLAGCSLGQSSPKAAPDSQQVLRVVAPGVFSLDPATDDDQSAQTLALLYSGLVTLDQNLRPVLSDAARMDVSPDGQTYTFHLRSDLRFTDGATITADDFAYSLNRAISPCGGDSQLLEHLKDALAFAEQGCANGTVRSADGQHAPAIPALVGDSIVVTDPATLRLTLDQPDAAFIAQLADLTFSVLDRRLVQSAGSNWTLNLDGNGGEGTTGMYVVKSIDLGSAPSSGPSQMVLVRNPHYWGPKPRLRELDLTFDNQTNGEPDYYTDYHAGKYDLLAEVPGRDYAAAHGDSGFHQNPQPALIYLQANLAKPPFDDLRVRQAFALALDKPAIAQLEQSQGALPTDHVVPDGIPGYNASLAAPRGAALSGAPTEARSLWQSYVGEKCGGNASRCPKVVIHSNPSSSVGDKEANAMATAWKAALPGAQIEIDTYQSDAFNVQYNPFAADHMTRAGWAGSYPDPQDWLAGILQVPAQASRATHTDPQAAGSDSAAEALLAKAQATTDPTKRNALYQQLEQRMVENVDVIPLYQLEAAWVARSYVVNYSPGSWYWVGPQQWATIYIAAH